MKKFFLLLTTCFMLSCSSDSSSGTSSGLSFNNSNYDFNKIYVIKMNGSYTVAITKGDMTVDFTVPNAPTMTYSSNFTRMLAFTIESSASSLPTGTYSFPIIPVGQPVTVEDNTVLFRDNYQINNGNPSSFNTVFNYTDNSSSQSRVVITKSDNDNYTFDFNVITTAGILTGNYSGVIIKTNF